MPLATIEPAAEIPASFAASWRSWRKTGESTMAGSEERLLRRLPYYQPTAAAASNLPVDHGVVAYSSLVPLLNPKLFLNTLTFKPTGPERKDTPTPVVLHGYGAGLAFFYRNFPALGKWVASRGVSAYAVDWLGMGRSSRPAFQISAHRSDTQARVAQAESFFIDALEEWRQKVGIQKMTLIAHSLGAYLSVVYALRYPDHVSRLILLSPAGVPENPNNEVPSRELDSAPQTSPPQRSVPLPATQQRIDDLRTFEKEQKRRESRTRRLFTYLWEEGWSPFQVVRSSLFFAPMLVGKYSSRRFSGLSEEEVREMHDYILNITLARGSGEYSISHLLAPGAIARLPLVTRVSAITIPVTFAYGDRDWMDPDGGVRSCANLRKAGNHNSRTVIIPNAGHHVYLDNHKAVDGLLVQELDRAIQ